MKPSRVVMPPPCRRRRTTDACGPNVHFIKSACCFPRQPFLRARTFWDKEQIFQDCAIQHQSFTTAMWDTCPKTLPGTFVRVHQWGGSSLRTNGAIRTTGAPTRDNSIAVCHSAFACKHIANVRNRNSAVRIRRWRSCEGLRTPGEHRCIPLHTVAHSKILPNASSRVRSRNPTLSDPIRPADTHVLPRSSLQPYLSLFHVVQACPSLSRRVQACRAFFEKNMQPASRNATERERTGKLSRIYWRSRPEAGKLSQENERADMRSVLSGKKYDRIES